MSIKIQTRNATLADLAALLQDQQSAKVDFVAPMSSLVSESGVITVKGTSVFGDGQKFLPTEIADGHLAARLGIPVTYLRTLRVERPDLFDANVNGWTQGCENIAEPDARNVMLRTFQSGDVDEIGVLRALLSDRYSIIDNFDALTAALEGVKASGTQIEVVGCDLTETRMTVRLLAPEVFVNSPQLLDGYRNPFENANGVGWGKGNLPEQYQQKFGVNSDGVFAGLVISNSETGGGAFNIVPRLTVLKCTNGMMMTRDALRKIHVGGKLDDGEIQWSDDTQRKSLDLIMAKTRDAVTRFLDPIYVQQTLDSLTEKSSTPIADPAKAIEYVGKKLLFSEETRASVLDHFIRGGQVTAGGVMQAVTSVAQDVESPDLAYALESRAVEALELAAAL